MGGSRDKTRNWNAYHRKYYAEIVTKFREEMGNKCEFCGWNKMPAVLQFAHKHGTDKIGPITKLVRQRSREKVRTELEKCFLLCPNCHAMYDRENGDLAE